MMDHTSPNMDANDIDTSNYQLVGVLGPNIVVGMPKRVMTKFEALVHAAYLMILAGDREEFERVLRAVEEA